jgi:hypothetical protein
MDIIFISKLLIIVALCYLTNYIYVETDWYTRGKKTWSNPTANKLDKFLNTYFNKSLDDILIFVYVIFWGLPFLYSAIAVGFIILFEGTLRFLDSRSYWEQIILFYGLIADFFAIQIYLNGRKLKLNEKDLIIDSQRKKIAALERKIQELE